MITVSNLSIQFGGNYLFEDVTFLIGSKDRIGLTGKNGAGKSTLLKIISGFQKPEKGEVSIQSKCTIGYLPQEMVHNLGKTVFEEASSAFVEVKYLEKEIEKINKELSEREDYESASYMELITKLNDANERFQMIGGYTMEASIEVILLGLGFEKSDFSRLMDEFSGGWRMRVELAKILLQKPSAILLDEPTNHLDIESIQWLEDFLKNYEGAVVMVSHDKAFLDNITKRTVEISLGQIYDYKANYSKYLELRKERREQQTAAAKNQEKYIQQTEQLINKYRAKASKASFAQSLIKKLDRLDRIEVDNEDNVAIRFRFPSAPRAGKVVLEVNRVAKKYGENQILKDINLLIGRQERIAFVGRNGEGKTTLLKIIVGDLEHEGEIKLGHNVEIGYYAQNQAELLDGEKSVFETIDDVAAGEIRKQVRSLLGSFLFSGDDVDKKVKVLSGGEKSRLALCKLLLHPYNLLVLDEPTNHLDIRSKEILKEAILKFDGTLIIVSHDRDFLKGLTDKVYEFKNGGIKEHIGDVQVFLKAKNVASLAELNLDKTKKEEKKKATKESNSNYEDKKKQDKEDRKIRNQISKFENEIAELETKVKEIDDKLLDPEQYKVIVNDTAIFTEYEKLKKELEQKMKKWGELNEKLES